MSTESSADSAVVESARQETEETSPESTPGEKVEHKPETETEPESKKEQASQKDKFAPKFAALSRKEKLLRQREREIQERLKQKEDELERKLRELSEKETSYKTREQLKRENPLKYLEEEGLSYEEITQALLNDGELPAEKKQEKVIATLQSQIAELTSRLEEKEKREREAREAEEERRLQERVDQTVTEYKAQIRSFIEETPEEQYELLKSGLFDELTDPVETVFSVIQEYYEKTKEEEGEGRILEISEAANLVEQYLEKEAQKIAKSKKLSKLLSSLKPSEEKSKQSKFAPSDSPKTLENEHSSQVPNRQGTKLSDDELIAEAANLIRWTK